MIKVLLICHCGKTHALIPDNLIPYSSYSLRFILFLLWKFSICSCTVTQFCNKWCIAISTIYKWLHMFIEHYNLWFGAIEEIVSLKKDSVKRIEMITSLPRELSIITDKLNFKYDSLNCFTLILSGEPVLNRTLERQVHEALRQRITVHYSFQGLNPDEVNAYIRHKLHVAGGAETIMGSDAVTAIAGFCKGNPRIIDNVMTTALKAGAQIQKTTIDSEVILAAVNEQSLG